MEDQVERVTLLVSPEGEWMLPGSAELLRALGDLDPDYDAVGFAVRNLGFIKFQVLHGTVVELELHPRNVALPTLLAVQEKLLTCNVRLFRIEYLDTEWRSEISSSLEQTLSRLSELCAPVYHPPEAGRFHIQERDYTTLFDDEANPMRPLLQKWRVSFGRFDPNIISLAMRQGLLPRMMVIGVKPRNPEPMFRFIGDGHRWLGNEYPVVSLGDRVESQPDKEYGAWVSEFYKSVATTCRPRYDLVSAVIETGKPVPYHASYERLLLPWKTPSDEIFVTLTSKIVEPDRTWEAA